MYEQWKALVELQWPNGRKAVLDIAHDHVGTSQFHPLHGQVRQARFNHSGKAADIYISGHRHTWGLMSTEMQGRVVWMCRAKGFKDHGEYEVVKGFEAQKLGHTITAIFDPSADTETGFLSCFAEPQEAAGLLRPTSEGVNNLIINRVLGGGDTLDFDQIFFEGQPRCDHKGVRWFVVPKYFFSDIAHGLQVFPVRYICSHLNKIC